MPTVAIDSVQELLENADNMNNGGDVEVPLTIIDETSTIIRLSTTRGSLIRLVTAKKRTSVQRIRRRD